MPPLLRVLRWESSVDERWLSTIAATVRREIPHYAHVHTAGEEMPSDPACFTVLSGRRALAAEHGLKYPSGLLHHLYRTIRPHEHRIAITDLPVIVSGNPFSHLVLSDDRSWALLSTAPLEGRLFALQHLILHKAGHFLGLRHCTTSMLSGPCAMMGSDDVRHQYGCGYEGMTASEFCEKCRTLLEAPYTRTAERCVHF